MKISFTVWLLAIAAGCSVDNFAKTAHVQNGNAGVPSFTSNAPVRNPPVKSAGLKTTVVKNGHSINLDCDETNRYRLVEVTDPERASLNSVTVPRMLNIISGDEIKAAIKIPTESDAQNFSLNSTEKTKEGFNITVEYGTRYYYKRQFNFVCREGYFYLYKVRVESFDKFDPVSRENWDIKEIKIKPNKPIEKFSILDYLDN